jgi:hypothetical protein
MYISTKFFKSEYQFIVQFLKVGAFSIYIFYTMIIPKIFLWISGPFIKQFYSFISTNYFFY